MNLKIKTSTQKSFYEYIKNKIKHLYPGLTLAVNKFKKNQNIVHRAFDALPRTIKQLMIWANFYQITIQRRVKMHEKDQATTHYVKFDHLFSSPT